MKQNLYILILIFSLGLIYSCKENGEKDNIEEDKITEEKVTVEASTSLNKDNTVIYNLHFGCGYDKEMTKRKEIKIFPASDRCEFIISKIMSFSGLNPNFEVFEINDNNASALIVENKRLILYDENLLNFSDYASDSYWSSISILAHEVGHHLSGHTLSKGQDAHKDELEADKFSGFVLYKMGASLDQAMRAIQLLGAESSTISHPNKFKRLNAIESGWLSANNQKYVSAVPPPPEDDERSFYIDEFDYDEVLTDEFYEAYSRRINEPDTYNPGYLEGIIIDVENIEGYGDAMGRGESIKLNILITKSTRPEPTINGKKVGERELFHMLNYRNTYNVALSWLDALLVPGRKIRFKSFFWGYGYENIAYLKKLNRNINSENITNDNSLNQLNSSSAIPTSKTQVHPPKQNIDLKSNTTVSRSRDEPINYKYVRKFDNVSFNPSLYSGPDVNTSIIYKCPKDAKIYVLDDSGTEFYLVSVNGHKGYVSKVWLSTSYSSISGETRVAKTNTITTQREKFNCDELSKYMLINKYNQYKNRGLKLMHNGVDVLPFVIDDLSSPGLRQMCINAWGEVDQNGSEYTHGKFQRRNFEISYKEYMNDIDYLEILSYLRYEMVKNLN